MCLNCWFFLGSTAAKSNQLFQECVPLHLTLLHSSIAVAGEKRVPVMPGSPVEVKIQTRSSPPNMPPLPPVNPGGPRPVSFTPAALPNGMNHSPPTLNGAPSPPQRFGNGPASSSSSSLTNQQLPATCGARQLSKLKRFLTTLQQFGNDISPEIGEKVRTLVLALVNSTVTIEEFHCKLQEATNFPLRPFVIPFLKANLPLLQRELLHCARAAKQTPSQYLAQHEHILLNTASSPADSSELLIEVNGNSKRHSPDRRDDSSFEREPLPTEPPAKRVCTISPAPRHSPALSIPMLNPGGQFHPTPPPLQHYTLEDIATSHLYRDPGKMLEHREIRDRHGGLGLNGGYQDELVDHRLTEREWADEWKHLDHALNCIMEMVEKTRRSMAVLRRCQEADREELNYWKRRCSEAEPRKAGGELGTARHSPGSSDSIGSDSLREFGSRSGPGYVTEEIWKKAEEAVNEVKRQAMSEVQKAVAEAEQKAFEMIASERARMEQTIADAKRQATEDAFLVINEQEESTESCWNCGRKASETCSGCNIARYCGSFCQHKDWERHHRICGQSLHGHSKGLALPAGRSAKAGDGVPSPSMEKSSAATSRSSTPASVTAIDTNGL
ncbi:protein CBFA2T2 [Lagopus leucura]|uniref:protein CBFA2T2 n=1 Tax=Lagopus leucura TaxID=30410 RepID=UPI001C684F19|nr:protein CBFA2T2 [Lagopus leucura]